jgi:hypothetical protein
MLRVKFEPTISVLEQAKTFRALGLSFLHQSFVFFLSSEERYILTELNLHFPRIFDSFRVDLVSLTLVIRGN